MKKVVNIVIENDGYLVRNNSSEVEFTRVMPQGIQRIPCIPFYHSAWMMMGRELKPVVAELLDVIKSQYKKIKGKSVMVAYPTDALPADVRMILQTMQYVGFDRVELISKSALVMELGVENYIAISATERLVVVEWYRDGVPTESRYYNKVAVGRKRLISDIEKIQKKQPGAKLKIYIVDGCSELGGLYNIGEVINEKMILKLLWKATKVEFKIKDKDTESEETISEQVSKESKNAAQSMTKEQKDNERIGTVNGPVEEQDEDKAVPTASDIEESTEQTVNDDKTEDSTKEDNAKENNAKVEGLDTSAKTEESSSEYDIPLGEDGKPLI